MVYFQSKILNRQLVLIVVSMAASYALYGSNPSDRQARSQAAPRTFVLSPLPTNLNIAKVDKSNLGAISDRSRIRTSNIPINAISTIAQRPAVADASFIGTAPVLIGLPPATIVDEATTMSRNPSNLYSADRIMPKSVQRVDSDDVDSTRPLPNLDVSPEANSFQQSETSWELQPNELQTGSTKFTSNPQSISSSTLVLHHAKSSSVLASNAEASNVLASNEEEDSLVPESIRQLVKDYVIDISNSSSIMNGSNGTTHLRATLANRSGEYLTTKFLTPKPSTGTASKLQITAIVSFAMLLII